jgi:hypothetical protein
MRLLLRLLLNDEELFLFFNASSTALPYCSSFHVPFAQAPFKFIDRVFNGLEIQQYGDGTTSRGEQ